VFFNTVPGCGYHTPVQLTAQIQFAKPLSKVGIAPYNPFIFGTYHRAKETHLVDHPPTDKADLAMFGTGDDTSDPAAGRLYRTEKNLVWAIDTPDPTDYPAERNDLVGVYPAFGDWAESMGKKAIDWFISTPTTVGAYHKTNK